MEELKDWTIMVYMAGDNNLSENMAASLDEIRGIGMGMPKTDRDQINVLAYFDSGSLTVPTHYIDYSDLSPDEEPCRHPIEEKDLVYAPEGRDVANPAEGNSASAYSILNFVNWCIKTKGCEAKNYALIFSAHSFGFYGTSFLRDETSGGFMTLFKFRWALEKICNECLGHKKIGILGFDSCVMSMLEVGFELKDVAQTVIASEGSLPNSGWGYAPMLKQFISNDNSYRRQQDEKAFLDFVETPDYVKSAVTAFVTAFLTQQRRMALGGRSVDMTAWDLDKIEPIARLTNELAIILNEHLDLAGKIKTKSLTDEDIVVFQELKKIILQAHFDAQTYMKEQSVDLKDFCQRLIIECKFFERDSKDGIFAKIRSKAREIILAIDDCVLKCGYSGDEFQFSNGISIYFPWTYVTYFLTDYRYRYLRFVKGDVHPDPTKPNGVGKDWNHFLFNYLTRVSLRPSRKNANGLSHLDDFSDNNPLWSKDNPPWNKDNPPWNKDNPPWNKDNPPWNKDNPPWNRGEVGDSLFYFGRFKNFQLRWDIFGYSDETKAGDKFE